MKTSFSFQLKVFVVWERRCHLLVLTDGNETEKEPLNVPLIPVLPFKLLLSGKVVHSERQSVECICDFLPFARLSGASPNCNRVPSAPEETLDAQRR